MTQVLVTRPLESSRQLAGQLDALGLAAIVMPLYSFAACEPAVELKSAWSSPGKRQLAVFTSPRAVGYGLPHLPHDGLDNLEIAAVGAATRTKLESHGHPVHLQSDTGYTSEDLLQMPELAADPGEAVIFCAPGGREALSDGLQALGWGVLNAMVYERIPLPPAQAQVDAIMAADDLLTTWTSVSALELARENIPAEAWDKILKAPALVISDRIAHHLQNLGASRVIRADGPGNSDLLQSIQRLTGRQNTA